MYRRGSPACAIGNQSDLAHRNCVFGNVERIDDIVQFVDLIATWNSHPIMPITLLLLQIGTVHLQTKRSSPTSWLLSRSLAARR